MNSARLDAGAVIEALYATFAGNPAPAFLDRSPASSEAAQSTYNELVRIPLREISADLISPNAQSALTTVGDESNYRYYLPRILDLALFETGHPGLEPWLTADKLR